MLTDMPIDLSLQRIRDFKVATGWPLNRLAKAADLNESTIRKLMAPDWNPTASTVRQLERVMLLHHLDASRKARAA